MIPAYVKGPIAPTFTAFAQDGRFDENGQRQFLDFLELIGGISAYFVRSGMGQMFAFDYDDVKAIARVVCGHLNGRAPVLVGTSGIWDRNRERLPDPAVYTQQAIELSQYAEAQGADGVVLTIPEGIRPVGSETPADVTQRYIETVAAAVSIPVFIYQSPGTDETYHVTPESLVRLAEIPNVYGIKASTDQAGYILNLCRALQGLDFMFITGNETGYYAGLLAGSRATIGQGCTVNPQLIQLVQDRFEAGDYDGMMEAQYAVNRLVRHAVNPVEFMKRYAVEHGFDVPLYARTTENNPYLKSQAGLTQAQYDTFKAFLEGELGRFGLLAGA